MLANTPSEIDELFSTLSIVAVRIMALVTVYDSR